jgi:hypothetical protein
MKKQTPANSDAAIASRLEALLDQVPLDRREVEDTLRHAGIDPKAATARMLARVAGLKERERSERFALAEADRLAALARMKSRRAEGPRRTRDEMLSRLAGIRKSYPAAAAMYRDFQTATEEDLASLLDDLEEMISSGKA